MQPNPLAYETHAHTRPHTIQRVASVLSQRLRTMKSATLAKRNELISVPSPRRFPRTKWINYSFLACRRQCRYSMRCDETIKFKLYVKSERKCGEYCESERGGDRKGNRDGARWFIHASIAFVHFASSAWINARNKVTNGIRQISLVHRVHHPFWHIRYKRPMPASQVPYSLHVASCGSNTVDDALQSQWSHASMYCTADGVCFYLFTAGAFPSSYSRVHCVQCAEAWTALANNASILLLVTFVLFYF